MVTKVGPIHRAGGCIQYPLQVVVQKPYSEKEGKDQRNKLHNSLYFLNCDGVYRTVSRVALDTTGSVAPVSIAEEEMLSLMKRSSVALRMGSRSDDAKYEGMFAHLDASGSFC